MAQRPRIHVLKAKLGRWLFLSSSHYQSEREVHEVYVSRSQDQLQFTDSVIRETKVALGLK